jgi:hypothetical protein
VFAGQEFLPGLDHDDALPETGKSRRQRTADGATADHDHPRGQFGQSKGRLGIENARHADIAPRGMHSSRSRGDDDRRGAHLDLAVGRCDATV